MTIPEYLKNGDKIAIISTARKVTIEDVYPAVEVFKSWGLIPVLGPNLFEVENQYAGTDQERLSDLMWAFQSSDIKAVICARGGYGSARLLENLNHQILIDNPKWLVGFSDVTVFLSLFSNLNIPSIHGLMPLLFKDTNANKSLISLKTALFGNGIEIEVPTNPFNKSGKCNGLAIGGNLSIINSLIGTQADIDIQGKILFLEDLDEYIYHIDRMFLHLKLAGKLENLAGLIIGHFSDLKDNKVPFGKTVFDIVLDHTSKYNYPVCFGFPVGHQFDNIAIKVGVYTELVVSDEKTTFFQS